MILSKLHIENFRSFVNTDIDIEDFISVVVGKNNTGKTSLKLILDKFINRIDKTFSLNDLNVNMQNQLKEQLTNDMDKSAEEINQKEYNPYAIKLFIHLNYLATDNLKNIAPLIRDLDVNNFEVVIGFAYYLKKENYLKLLDDYKLLKTEFAKADESCICPDVLYLLRKSITDYFETKCFIGDEKKDDTYTYNIPLEENIVKIDSITIQNIIKFEYISAERKVSNSENNQSAGKTLSVLASNYWAVNRKLALNNGSDDIRNKERKLEIQFMKSDEDFSKVYNEVFEDVMKEIKEISTSKDLLRVVSSMQEQQILEQNSSVRYEHNGKNLPEDYNGLGYMNLFEIIFKLQLIKKVFEHGNDGDPCDINFLFIEEPEAHMHPQMQSVFIKNIDKLLKLNDLTRIQTIISTHSSNIVSNLDLESFKYFTNDSDKKGIIVKNLKSLKPKLIDTKRATTPEEIENVNNFDAYKFVKQYISLNKAEIFFADKIIFIEGETERILLPSIMKKIDNEYASKDDYIPLCNQNISIIEVGAYAKIFEQLLQFLGIKTLIITDIDSIDKASKAIDTKNGTDTSNCTIKYFLPNKTLADYKSLTLENKIINPNLALVYQIEENGYWARSFEDAFISINFDWLKNIEDSLFLEFSIKNRTKFNDSTTSFYDKAKECIASKTNFATSIIFESIDEQKPWIIPSYIKEGLIWLSK